MGRTPKLDKLNQIQLISLDKLSPIQLIRILILQSLITLRMPKMAKKFLQMKTLLKMSENVPDVSWNAPFKNSIRELHSDWMLHGDKPTTSGGNLRAPPMEIYLEWIVSAWEALSKDVIVKSFLCCGITKEDDEKNDALIHVFKKNGAIPNGLALLQQRRHEENMIKLVEEIDLNEDDNLGSDFSIEL
uniref:DDE-1 domain-containing protein n=1 Tax=Globodera rostochiensis TaxID=31243 RepID=A0A914H9Q3_GLORO